MAEVKSEGTRNFYVCLLILLKCSRFLPGLKTAFSSMYYWDTSFIR